MNCTSVDHSHTICDFKKMSWILTAVRSSIGKKFIMALSGAFLATFLLAHLAGNVVSFWGKEAYDTYAGHLHDLGFPLHVLEGLLLLVFLVHVVTATALYLENLAAKPKRYAVQGIDRDWCAATMPYSGLVILLFLLVHLANFHFSGQALSTAAQVRTTLDSPPLAIFYLLALSGLTLHLSHGLWSLSQSMGINHPNYNKLLQSGGLFMAVGIGLVFLLIPVLVLTTERFLQ